MKDKSVIIIGAGIAGLSSAALLAQSGYHVTVLEKNPIPGGAAGVFSEKGFTFDMGPSWYLMPEVYEKFFALFGKKTMDYYSLTHLEPSYRVFFEGSPAVSVFHDLEKNIALFDTLEKNGGEKLKRFLDNSKKKYTIALEKFLFKEYNSFLDFMNPLLILQGLQLNVFSRLDRFVRKFFTDDKSRKIVEFNTVFLGSSPYHTPALYSLMSHADLTQGVYYPQSGIYAFVKALTALAESLGVRILCNSAVEKILVANQRTVGVRTNKETYNAEIVISACDYHYTDTELLDKPYANYSSRYWKTRKMAPSTFLMFLGVNKKIPELGHHNFYFCRDWKKHFDSIFEKPDWVENPCYYITVPSKTDPHCAPAGCENLFVLVPVAPDLEDSLEQRNKYANCILNHIEKTVQTNFVKDIAVQRIFSQSDFKASYNNFKGTALGLSHTLFQTALFRPSKASKRVRSLYYTGHYTQPGIGMPMAVIGSMLLHQRILSEQR